MIIDQWSKYGKVWLVLFNIKITRFNLINEERQGMGEVKKQIKVCKHMTCVDAAWTMVWKG